MRVGLAASLAVAGLVALALVYAGPAPYAALARGNGFERNVFHVPARALTQREVRYDLATLVALHEWTLRYVLDVFGATALPRDPTIGDPLFTGDEQAHLDDVRRVFAALRALAAAAVVAAAAVLLLAWRRGPTAILRLARDSALVAAIGVAGVGAIAAVAFEPAFLAFHRVFFPQGNFLFGEDSNLLALYPEAYWYGVTVRIAVAFIVGAGMAAAFAHLALRALRERSGSAIVRSP